MKKRVLVGLSGGVDSAVSAYLLQQQGYEVVGGFMKNYISEAGFCTTRIDADEAIKVAKFLGIELLAFDFQKQYEERILNYIYEGYKNGITPNPDVFCNNLVKFDLFLDEAIKLGFDYIATGHYARIISLIDPLTPFEGELQKVLPGSEDLGGSLKYHLLRGVDYNKDQSYFLSGLNQYQLSKSIFPIGDVQKPEVREIAKKIGLPNAERKDSQGLCFVGNISIKSFLMQKLPVQKGDIVDTSGKNVGKHDGARFFTIGQKQGLGLNFKAYVTKIDVKNNIITVGDKEDENLSKEFITATQRHRISKIYESPLRIKNKIRYRQEPQDAILEAGENGEVKISFPEKQRAVAPGQIVVAYIGDECIGNGIIS